MTSRSALFRLLSTAICILVGAAILTLPTRAQADEPGYVGSALTATGDGYWLVTASGRVTANGTARSFGDTSALPLKAPIIAMAATGTGSGYWLLASDGGIFTFGDAQFFGSTGSLVLNQPVVAMASTPSGRGYWLAASDGGIFTFGDAQFFGSTGAMRLNRPVVTMSAAPDGRGYWLAASDGGIFTFGSSAFFGSTGALNLNRPIVAMSTTTSGRGYWMIGDDGGVFAFGDAPFRGAATTLAGAARAMTILRDITGGYTVVRRDGSVVSRPGELGVAPTIPSLPTVPLPGAYNATWRLKQSEDFNSSTLDARRWPLYDGRGSGGIGTVSRSAVSMTGSALRITSRGLVTGGTCWCDGTGGATYGRWEVRARMTNGNGHWPAVLLWPDSGRWPQDGEIDIAEFSAPNRNHSSFTVHYGATNQQLQFTSAGDFTQWHTFAVDWQPGYLRYYLDGELKYTVTKAEAIPKTPMHLALQTASGDGRWLASPGPNDSDEFEVDWVKQYHPN